MARDVLIRLKKLSANGKTPANAKVRFTPTIIRADAEGYILDEFFDVIMVDGEGTANDLPETDLNWAYKVEIRGHGAGAGIKKVYDTWFVHLPAGEGTVNFEDLPRIDPKTLTPVNDPDPAWVDAVTAVFNDSVSTAVEPAMVTAVEDETSEFRARLNAASGDALATPGTPAWEAVERRRIAPSAFVYESRADLYRSAKFQEDDGTIYATQSKAGTGAAYLEKTTDYGKTWTTLGQMPGSISSLLKLRSGTLLAFEATQLTVADLNPKVWRSTDDGQSWTHVFSTQFPPFANGTGVAEGTDGSVLISEYGNVNDIKYKIYRSTDDGQTFTPVWESPAMGGGVGDVGHIHSLVFDPYEQCHVAFCDLPNTSTAGPYWLRSDDNGATWTKFGEATGSDTPNTVRPLFFENYVAWGTDNERNGRFGRIKREDFYAGNMSDIEVIATVNGKSMYYTFPIRPGVWLVSASLEAIHAPEGEVVDYAQEAFIVSEDGALVTGAFAYDQPSVTLGTLHASGKIGFPAHYYDAVDHAGLTMTNMPWGDNRNYIMAPVSQGISPSTHQIGNLFGIGSTTLPNNLPLQWETSTGADNPVLRVNGIDDVVLTNESVPASTRPEIVLRNSDGYLQFRQGGTQVAYLRDKKLVAFNTLWLAPNGVSVTAGSGTPEGSVTAPIGSVYVSWSLGTASTLWTKAEGSGNTGWRPAGVYAGGTGSRPGAPVAGQSYFDTTLGHPIWWNGTAWVDATGVAV